MKNTASYSFNRDGLTTTIIGDYDGGLVKIDKASGQTTFYTHSNSGLPANKIASLAADLNGDLWILYESSIIFHISLQNLTEALL
jgi:ligand-binding sensor domain-containing protein